MAIYKRDIVDINLETGNIHRSFLKHSIGYLDQQADRFGIRTYRDGAPVDLSGVSVQGIFMPPQGSPISITGVQYTAVSGNVAIVVLPQACYNYDGQFTLAIKLVDSTNAITGTMRIIDGVVDNTHASGTVAPTSAVPTYQEILATYDAMVAATAATNASLANYYSDLPSRIPAGTYCIYNHVLYRCIATIASKGAWDATKWVEAKLADDTSDLKSALDRNLSSDFTVPYAYNIGTLVENGQMNPNGTNGSSNASYTRTNYQTYNFDMVVYLDSTDYEFVIWTYSAPQTSKKVEGSTFGKYIAAETPTLIRYKTANNCLRVGFRRKDLGALTTDTTDPSSDYYKILHGIRFFKLTDDSLENANKPADAKVTGDKINVIDENIENLIISNCIPESWTNVWESGGIKSDDGTESTNSKRIRFYSYMKVDTELKVNVPLGMKVLCARYSAALASSYIGMTDFAEGALTYRFPGEYIRLVAAYKDESDIAESAGSSVIRTNYLPTDKTLTLENKPADAKAAGKALVGTLDLKIEKGGWTNKGIKVSNTLGLRSGEKWNMTPGSVLTVFLDTGWVLTLKEGDTDSKFAVTHDKVRDERIVISKPYVVFQFNKYENGEIINLSVSDFDNSVIIHSSGDALNTVEQTEGVHDLPENPGQLNVVFRAYQMSKIMYETQNTLPRHSGGSKTVTVEDVPKGTPLTGIPYSSMRETMASVPQATSIDAFRTMIENPDSYIYTKHYEQGSPGYDYNSRCYVGAVCSTLVAYCYGIDDVIPTTISFADYPGLNPLPASQQNPESLKLADMLNRAGDHIVIITDIIRNERGRIKKIEVTEAWKPMCRSLYYTPDQIRSKYFDTGFVAYRYENVGSVTYTPSPWVHVDDTETGTPVYNTVLSPKKGEKSNWSVSELVEIDVMDNTAGYTDYVITNRFTSETVETDSIPSGDVIQIAGLSEGKYSAYLTDGANNSDSVDFDVIDAEASYEDQGNSKVKVTFEYASNRIPSAVYWCCNKVSNSGYKAVVAFHIITASEIENGYAIVEEPTDQRSENTTDGKWLMRVGFKTEYGLFASDLEEVHVD